MRLDNINECNLIDFTREALIIGSISLHKIEKNNPKQN